MSLKYLVRAAVIVKIPTCCQISITAVHFSLSFNQCVLLHTIMKNKAYYCHVIKPTKFLGKRYSILNRSKYQSLTVFHPPLSPSLQYELIILYSSITIRLYTVIVS